MIVRYVRERRPQNHGEDQSLTLGKEYVVLGIVLDHGFYSEGKQKESYVTVQSDNDNYPCLFDLKFFNIIDPNIPEGWTFLWLENGVYHLKPQEFVGDFWDLFHDGNKEAERIFAYVVKKIKAFHGLLPQEMKLGDYIYVVNEEDDVALLKFLREIQTGPMNADLSEQLLCLDKEIQALFNKVKKCDRLKDAMPYFCILSEIRATLVRLSFKHDNLPIRASCKKFITYFDCLDDEEWCGLLFKKIKNGEYDLLS